MPAVSETEIAAQKPPEGAASGPPPGLGPRAKRLALLTLIGLASLNIWTGGPLLALWIASQTQGSGPPKMHALLVVTIVLTAVSLGLVRLIAVLQRAYDKASGADPGVRAHTPWLRSVRGERRAGGERPRVTAPERILIVIAILAVLAFELWFFFLSGSPFDQRSGRAEAPVELAAGAARAIAPV